MSAPDQEPTSADATASTFYVKHAKVYPREVSGRFAKLRTLAVWVLLGIYYVFPWLTWNDRQAVLFDLPDRKFYLFGWVFWPQDFFYLALLLIIAALSLFFFTAMAGRLWCGYACPQTVWTETFLWIERWVEGDRAKRMKLDQMPSNSRKLILKSIKHTIWIFFSLWTGFTFVGFFSSIHDFGARLLVWNIGPWETFWLFFYSFATYGNAGWLREQVCIYMCPYARFQSAMFDKDTLIISYDSERGEPRGSRRRGVDPRSENKGDCIDCTLCVQVCPTGIDIRNGLQYQCIGCAACIDVCDDVMERMNYPKGLIRYTTEHALMHRQPHVIRPRVLVYAGLLAFLVIGLLIAIANRTPLELDAMRDRNSLYSTDDQGRIENVYTLKLINMDERPHRFALSLAGLPGMQLLHDNNTDDLQINSGEVYTLPVRVAVDPSALTRTSTEIEFRLVSLDTPNLQTSSTSRFLGPYKN